MTPPSGPPASGGRFERDRARLHALLQAALDRAPQDRERWADEACGGDTTLRARLAELLHAVHQETESHTPAGVLDGILGGNAGTGTTGKDIVDEYPSAPPLTPGQYLGRYEILDVLGAGGMGTVYRALDPSLGREVAIKALARAFRGDVGSLRRFEREARVLAALSHPNIAAIYGFERLDGSPYLVLERVDGETLAQRLARGPMPWPDAVAVAIQIVEGLEEAHGKGVIHRDLKPSNVMLAPGGRAKLVDFGLAKTAPSRTDTPGGDTDVSAAITATGAVLGTARYMSPEQIQGEEVDTRTDVWAFGCLLYEMLTGRPGFPGRSVPEVLAAVLRDEPDWSALPDDVPGAVRRLLRRCLRRELHTRLQHIGDARLELLDAEVDPAPAAASDWASGSAPAMWGLPATRATRRRVWTVAIGTLALLGAVVAGLFLLRSPSQGGPPRPVRLSLELPSHLALGSDYSAPFAVAPSGSTLAIEAVERETRRLYIRSLGDVALRALPGTDGARQPFFSPDGAWVAFFQDRKLTKVPVGGGPVLALADIGGNPRGATWAADGTIVVAPSQTSGLVRIADAGGRAVALTTPDRVRGEYSHRWPEALPGGRWVIFTVGLEDASFDEARIEAVSLATGERRIVLAGAGFARYLSTGQLLFLRGGRLYAVAFDPERLVVGGTPEVLLDAVRYDPRNGGTHLAVSASGVLIYGPGVPSSAEYYLSWVDREGRLRRAVDTPRPFRDPRLSPDGRQVAIAVGTALESDLWLVDTNATLSRLSFGLSPYRPAWTADGRRITVGAEKAGMWRLLSIAADGSGVPAVLYESPNRVYPGAWSADGRHLIFQENRPETGWDLQVLRVDGTGAANAGRPVGAPQPLAVTPFHETAATFSPDGKWVAYESDELDGIVQVYARSFPDGAHKVRVSSGGARWPVWGPNGDLYYRHTGQDLMHVARTRREGDQLVVGAIEPLWSTESRASANLARMIITVAGARYDVDPSGARFLVLETAATGLDPALSRPVLVLDWAQAPPPR